MNSNEQFLTRPGPNGSVDDLIRTHYAAVVRLAASILDDPQDAEDAAQETFIRLAAHLPDFRGEAALKTWLFSIAINICRTELRKRHRRDLLGKAIQTVQSLVSRSAAPEEQAAQDDLCAQLRQAVAELDEKHRFPVILRYGQGMSVEQIATILGANENTIHSRLFHARRKLAKRLEDIPR